MSAFQTWRTVFDTSGKAIQLTVGVYPADRSEFVINVGDVPSPRWWIRCPGRWPAGGPDCSPPTQSAAPHYAPAVVRRSAFRWAGSRPGSPPPGDQGQPGAGDGLPEMLCCSAAGLITGSRPPLIGPMSLRRRTQRPVTPASALDELARRLAGQAEPRSSRRMPQLTRVMATSRRRRR